MRNGSELRLRCPARSRSVAPIRHALRAFLGVLSFDVAALDNITTAAGEALANAAEHAYLEGRAGRLREVEPLARLEGGGLRVEVSDTGCFVERSPLPGRGFGLRIILAIAHQMQIDTTAGGTRVRMVFPGPIPEN